MTAGASIAGSSAGSSSSAAADALALLLREDPRLVELQMTTFYNPHTNNVDDHYVNRITTTSTGSDNKKDGRGNTKNIQQASLVSPNEEAAFAYAASLMHEDEHGASGWMTPSPGAGVDSDNSDHLANMSGSSGGADVQSRAQEALAEVDRKLAMVSGLAERLVRDYPEGVSETLLKLHGCSLNDNDNKKLKRQNSTASNSSNPQDEGKEDSGETNTNLLNMRDKCERLHRQADVLEGVAVRVESSLEKQYLKLKACTTKLQRVLALSSTLKMAMRLQFESKKILGCGGLLRDLMESSNPSSAARSGSMLDVDLRDLTRAASSVATMEQLLADPELHGGASLEDETELVEVVEAMRPEVSFDKQTTSRRDPCDHLMSLYC
jgi:hypothetical protein